MESLLPPNTPEEYVYTSICNLLGAADQKSVQDSSGILEKQLDVAEYKAALGVLGQYDYTFPAKVALTWITEPAKQTIYDDLGSVEVGYVHLNYPDTTTLYIFTKDQAGEVFCSKEVYDERHTESLEEARRLRSREAGEPKLGITTAEINMLSRMMHAITSVNNQN